MAISRGYEGTRLLRRPSVETVVLGVVCLLDLVITAVLVRMGLAEEANPLMAYFMGYGIAAFCVAKLFFVIPPLLVAEWYRTYNDQLIRQTLRVVTVVYVVLWAGGIWMLNAGALAL